MCGLSPHLMIDQEMKMAKKTEGNKTETAPKADEQKGVWFILCRNIENHTIPVESQRHVHNRATGALEVEGNDRVVRFEGGLYYATDKDEIEAIKRFCNPDLPEHGRIEECSAIEVQVIQGYLGKGFPRKNWHEKLMELRRSMNPMG